MQTSRKRCFVIMPFSLTTEAHTREYWDNHFENFLKPLIDSCSEVEAFRSVPLRQDILRQIINDLVFSPIVVADLTDSNPNVYWELGVRQSFRHGTITIANQDTTNLPFDIETKGTLFYSSNPSERDNFSRRFKDAINDCVSNPNRPDSLVLETVTGRGSIYSVIHHQELIQRVNGLIVENETNRTILQWVSKCIQENESRLFASLRPTYGVIKTHLGCSALDLLLAEHYLEEEPEFYEDAHNLLTVMYSINENFSNWSLNNQAGKWFLEKESVLRDCLNQFHDRLDKIRQKLLTTY